MPNPLQNLVDRMYGLDNPRGPYFYLESPYGKGYGMGDLVPGNMPTRFGPLMPIPEAPELLATMTPASTPAEFWNASPEQGAGQWPWIQTSTPRGLPANLDASPGPGIEINGQTFMTPMPSIFYPRPDTEVPALAPERPVRALIYGQADKRRDAGIRVPRRFGEGTMPSLYAPAREPDTSFACWVNSHPVLALGIAGLVYWAFSGDKKR